MTHHPHRSSQPTYRWRASRLPGTTLARRIAIEYREPLLQYMVGATTAATGAVAILAFLRRD